MKKLFSLALSILLLFGCASQGDKPAPPPAADGQSGPERSMELQFATEFSIDYYPGGCKLITLGDGSRFLVIPEGGQPPAGLAEGAVPLRQPIGNIYLAATSAMCLFDSLGRLDAIRLSGTRADGWYIQNAARAMEQGGMLYAGKYSEPDYELILDEGCELAVESTMIARASEVKDKLEELGVPVLIDQSSHEAHPLGRAEWIKLYAALLDEEQKAERLFSRQVGYLEEAAAAGGTGRTVAFFHINSSGQAVVRKSGDYVSRMIELAGGDYIFDGIGDPEDAGATETIEMETFFAAARDADCLIYNGTIGGGVQSLAGLVEQNGLLAEFKAVKSGDVWCTTRSMFQDTVGLGRMISDFHAVFAGGAAPPDGLEYIYRLQ